MLPRGEARNRRIPAGASRFSQPLLSKSASPRRSLPVEGPAATPIRCPPWRGARRSPTRMSPSPARRGRRRWSGRVRSPPTELVQLSLDRIARLDPAAERLSKGLRREGAARSRAGRSAAEGRRGAATARRPDRDQERGRRRRRGQHPRDRRLHRAGGGRLGDGAAAARGGRDRRRADPDARAGDLRLHRVGDLRRHPQSLEPAAHTRGLERGQRGGGRLGDGPDRLRRRRRRLDSDPRRLVRAVRHQAPAWPDLAGPRPRTLERPRRRRLCQPHGARQRPLARHLQRRVGRARRAAPARPPVRRGGEDSAREASDRLVDDPAARCRAGEGPRVRRGRRDRYRRAARLAGSRGLRAGPRLGRDRQQHLGAVPPRRLR